MAHLAPHLLLLIKTYGMMSQVKQAVFILIFMHIISFSKTKVFLLSLKQPMFYKHLMWLWMNFLSKEVGILETRSTLKKQTE